MPRGHEAVSQVQLVLGVAADADRALREGVRLRLVLVVVDDGDDIGYTLSYARMMELEARLAEKEWSGEPGVFARLRIR